MSARFFFVLNEIKAIKDQLSTSDISKTSPPLSTAAPTVAENRRRFILLGIAALLVLIALVLAMNNGSEPPQVERFGMTRAIQLEVQNGSGEARLAQKLTEYLRVQGFDVVEMGNYKSSSVSRTMVIDRVGNPEAANLVASTLGVSSQQITQQIDKNLFLDVTVVIGKDFATLKAFR